MNSNAGKGFLPACRAHTPSCGSRLSCRTGCRMTLPVDTPAFRSCILWQCLSFAASQTRNRRTRCVNAHSLQDSATPAPNGNQKALRFCAGDSPSAKQPSGERWLEPRLHARECRIASMLYATEAFRRHPCRVFASEPGLQGSPQTKSILQTSHSSPIGGGGVGKRKKTATSVSISQESVGINNRRSFNPALIAAHSSIALRRRLLHKSINEYSNTPSRLLHSRWHRHNSSHHTKCPRLLRHGRHHDHRSTNHPETDLHHQGRTLPFLTFLFTTFNQLFLHQNYKPRSI